MDSAPAKCKAALPGVLISHSFFKGKVSVAPNHPMMITRGSRQRTRIEINPARPCEGMEDAGHDCPPDKGSHIDTKQDSRQPLFIFTGLIGRAA